MLALVDIENDMPMGVCTTSLNKCCICYEPGDVSNIIISCTQCTDGQLCQPCKETCDVHHMLDTCPVCRSGGDWYKTIREYNNSVRVEVEDHRIIWRRKLYNNISVSLSNIMQSMLGLACVFGIGVMSRIADGDMPFENQHDMVLEIMLTMIIGLLVLIAAMVLFMLLLGIVTICIAGNCIRE